MFFSASLQLVYGSPSVPHGVRLSWRRTNKCGASARNKKWRGEERVCYRGYGKLRYKGVWQWREEDFMDNESCFLMSLPLHLPLWTLLHETLIMLSETWLPSWGLFSLVRLQGVSNLLKFLLLTSKTFTSLQHELNFCCIIAFGIAQRSHVTQKQEASSCY